MSEVETDEERDPYDDEAWDYEEEDDELCIEEGGTGPCRHFRCDKWGGDGLCFLTMGG